MRRFVNKIKGKKASSRTTVTRDPSPNSLEAVSNVPTTSTSGSVHVQEPSTGNDPAIDTVSVISKSVEAVALDEALPNSSETYEEISEWLEQGLSVARDISEATSVLAPLKATCMIVIRGLQLAKVSLASVILIGWRLIGICRKLEIMTRHGKNYYRMQRCTRIRSSRMSTNWKTINPQTIPFGRR